MKHLNATCGIALAVLVAAATGCGSIKPVSTNTVAPPAGYPRVYGWDGVTNRMVMANVLYHTTTPPGGAIDPSTWILSDAGWSRALPAEALPSIQGRRPVLVYDSYRNREVLVLGSAVGMPGGADTTQVWEWDGYSWQQKTTQHSIPTSNTQWLTAAYSPDLRAVVLIDTQRVSSQKPATWLYDGADWQSIFTLHWPYPPGFENLSYNASLHAIVALAYDFTTWVFNGRDWLKLPVDGVSPWIGSGMGRQAPAVTFDSSRNVWVLFGGSDGCNYFGDTWIGERTSWTQRSVAVSPAARAGAAMVWDPKHRRALLFGGIKGWPQETDLGDSWAWDGTAWRQISGPSYPSTSPCDLLSTQTASASR